MLLVQLSGWGTANFGNFRNFWGIGALPEWSLDAGAAPAPGRIVRATPALPLLARTLSRQHTTPTMGPTAQRRAAGEPTPGGSPG